jgi:hypothetical protein
VVVLRVVLIEFQKLRIRDQIEWTSWFINACTSLPTIRAVTKFVTKPVENPSVLKRWIASWVAPWLIIETLSMVNKLL